MKTWQTISSQVRSAFDSAVEMCGCGDPETMDAERAKLRRLEAEVLGELRKLRLIDGLAKERAVGAIADTHFIDLVGATLETEDA